MNISCKILSVSLLLTFFDIYSQINVNESSLFERKDLPIAVCDETWNIFNKIQQIEKVKINIDTTWQNNSVSKNVKAQFLVLPSEFELGINIYDIENLNEEIFLHEILHAKYIVTSQPFFYGNKFPEQKTLANLENSIQHFFIYKKLDSLGFKINKRIKKQEWTYGIKMLNQELLNIPPNAPTYVLETIGASLTLDGLVNGMKIEYIRNKIPQRLNNGIEKGIEIFKILKEANLSNVEDNFKIRLKIASILNLTQRDVVIGRLDFINKHRFYYDPINGELLQIK